MATDRETLAEVQEELNDIIKSAVFYLNHWDNIDRASLSPDAEASVSLDYYVSQFTYQLADICKQLDYLKYKAHVTD